MADTTVIFSESEGSTITASPHKGPAWWGKFNNKLILDSNPFVYQNAPSEWDVVKFGPNDTPLPGLATIRRIEQRMKLHRKEHPSSDFESQTFMGWSVVEFDFDLEIWTGQHLADLVTAKTIILPGQGSPQSPQSSLSVTTVSSTFNIVNPTQQQATATQGTNQIQTSLNTPKTPPIPIKVTHPALQIYGVSHLVFVHMHGPVRKSKDIPDLFVVSFKTVQFKPSNPVQHHTLKQTQTLTTGLGVTGIPAAQQPNQGPSLSGGADPFLPAGIIPQGPLT
jgi:hypothetical protein